MFVFLSSYVFFTNKFGVSRQKSIKDVILSFYNVEEIICAKETLHNELTKLNLLDVPRLCKHQHKHQGDSWSSRDVDGLAAYVTHPLPTFKRSKIVAFALSRQSSVSVRASTR